MSRNDQIEALIGGNASVEYQRDGFRRTSTRAPTPHPQERLMDSRKRSRDEFENPEPRAENGYQHRQTNEPGGWSFARTLKWLASSASSFLPVRTDISLKKVGYGDLKQMVRNQDYSLSRQAAELQELEKRLQRKESILDKHIREIGIQTWLLADRKAICDRQAQTIDEQANEVRSCKKEARAKDAEIQHLGQVLLEVKAEHSRQVRGVGDKETIIQQLRQNLQKAQAEQSQQDQTLRKLQESAASRLEPAGWTQDDDEAVRRKFALLDKSVQKWSKKYNIGSLDFMSHANLDEKARLQQTWSIFARSIEVPGDLLDPEMATKAPQLLLTGWLSYYVYDKIFDQPFFFLDNRLPSSGGGGISSRGFEKGQETHRGMANLMKDMLDEFTDCDKKQGISWRADTLRMLLPLGLSGDEQYATTSSGLSQSWTKEALMSAGEKFANDFMATAGLLIQAPNAVEAKKELLELFKSATELAYKVWTRKNDVEVVHLSDFRSLDFDPKSEMMTHHALHNAELHKDENCLTGRPIILVASPAVVVRGRSDGTEYDLERVWKSAVVFMLRKEPSEKIKQEQKAVEAIIKKEQKQPEPEAVKVKKEEFESKWDKSSENGHEVVRYRD